MSDRNRGVVYVGGGRVEVFAAHMHADVMRRLEMASELRAAITAGKLGLEYQPVVEFPTSRVVGVEALVRWSRDGHPVPPTEFLVAFRHLDIRVTEDLRKLVKITAVHHVPGREGMAQIVKPEIRILALISKSSKLAFIRLRLPTAFARSGKTGPSSFHIPLSSSASRGVKGT